MNQISRYLASATMILVAAVGLGTRAALAVNPEEIVGVWRTVDASDAEGREQGGIVFRRDGTGAFLSAKWRASETEMRAIFNSPGTGAEDIGFEYSSQNDIVTTRITSFRGLRVSSQPKQWLLELNSNQLKMRAQDGSGKWISFTKEVR